MKLNFNYLKTIRIEQDSKTDDKPDVNTAENINIVNKPNQIKSLNQNKENQNYLHVISSFNFKSKILFKLKLFYFYFFYLE